MRRRGAVARQKTSKVKRGLKSGPGATRRQGRAPLGGGVEAVKPKPTRKRPARKPEKPKMRVGTRGK